MPANFCEGGYLFSSDVAEFLRSQVEGGRLAYYGTLKASPNLTPPLRGDYSVLFRLVSEPSAFFTFELDDGDIVALGARGVCGGVVPSAADASWLAPLK